MSATPAEKVIFDIIECVMCGETFRAGADPEKVSQQEFTRAAEAAHAARWETICAERPDSSPCPASAAHFERYIA